MDRCEGGGARAISLARLTCIVCPCRAYTSKLNKNKCKKKTSLPIIVRCVHVYSVRAHSQTLCELRNEIGGQTRGAYCDIVYSKVYHGNSRTRALQVYVRVRGFGIKIFPTVKLFTVVRSNCLYNKPPFRARRVWNSENVWK